MGDYENPAMYRTAMEICHKYGIDYHHPVTGKTYPAPKKKGKKKCRSVQKRGGKKRSRAG